MKLSSSSTLSPFFAAVLKCISVCLCAGLKELERSMELVNNSYQRQLAAEKKRTVNAQEEIQSLQEQLERMTNKLKVHTYRNILQDTNRKILSHFVFVHEKPTAQHVKFSLLISLIIRKRREN